MLPVRPFEDSDRAWGDAAADAAADGTADRTAGDTARLEADRPPHHDR